MKTAIVLSGHIRTLDRCLPTQHWHVYRHYPDADFFVSTVRDADFGKVDLLINKYGMDRVKVHAVEEQPDCVADMRAKGVNLPSEWFKGQPYTHEPYAISVHPQAVLRQLWQLEQAWTAFPELAGYKCIIRTRPDLWFQLNDSTRWVVDGEAWTPNWGQFGGVNDRFAILGAKAAQAYFETYSAIPRLASLGCPIHPESLIRASLESAGVDIYPHLNSFFGTLRSNGEMRQPEISAADLLMR